MRQERPCEYCAQNISFDEPANAFQLGLTCPRCGHANVVDCLTIPPIPIPRRATVSPARLDPIGRVDDPDAITALLRGLAGDLLREAVNRIRTEYFPAQNALISLMARRERLLQSRIQGFHRFDIAPEPRMFNRVVDLLFAILSLIGTDQYCIRPGRSTNGVAQFLSWFEPLALETVSMASLAAQLKRGEIEAVLEGETLTARKTERHTHAIQWKSGRVSKERRNLEEKAGFEMFALRAQRIALGFDASELFDLLKDDFCGLRADARIEKIRGVTLIQVEPSNSSLSTMLGLCSLTSERLKTFRAPFFFDTGKLASQALTAESAILQVVAHNWSYYYPFFSFSRPLSSALHLATTRGVLVVFFANLESQKNSVIDHLLRSAKEKGNERVCDELNDIKAKASSALEAHACAIGRASGWLTFKGPNSLPCGDIDALFAKVDGAEVLLILAEVKAADFAVHRPDVYEVQYALTEKAAKQLRTKAMWVAAHWNAGFAKNVVGDNVAAIKKGKIVKVLLTRETQPLEAAPDAECVAIDELPHFLKQFQHGIPDWFSAARQLSIVDFPILENAESRRNFIGS